MTCHARGAAYLFTVTCVFTGVLGCGTAPSGAPPAGITPGSAARLEVFALEEVTRMPIVGAEVVFEGASAILGTARTDDAGRAVLETTEAATAIEVRADDHVAERWSGFGGRRVAVPLQRHTTPMHVQETLLGAEGEWTVVATSPARVLHAGSLATSVSAPCVTDASGCAFTLEAPIDATASFFAFHSTDGRPDELRVLGALSDTVDLRTATRFGVTEVDVTLPEPALGAEAVVGVPGIAVSGRVAVLPWPMGASSIALPDTDGELGSAWAVFSTTLTDGGTSVLVQRDVAPDASLSTWTDWLAAPEVSPEAGGVRVSAEGALLVIAWYRGTELLRNDLVISRLGGLASPTYPAPEGATSARVRAVETSLGTQIGTFDLDAAERGVLRLAEREVALP